MGCVVWGYQIGMISRLIEIHTESSFEVVVLSYGNMCDDETNLTRR